MITIVKQQRKVTVDRKKEKEFEKKVREVFSVLETISAEDSSDYVDNASPSTLKVLQALKAEINDWRFEAE